jgi:hypothetical protein
MKIVYTDYFQKSKVFLYPLLGLGRGIEFVPKETFLSWNKQYTTTDYKLICVYNTKRTVKFKNFELKFLTAHSMYETHFDLGTKQVYIFDMRPFKHDYNMLLKGSYSKFSKGSQVRIMNYFVDKDSISNIIESFFNPSDYHREYAKYLDVEINQVQNVYEICSKPDLSKENFNKKFPITCIPSK